MHVTELAANTLLCIKQQRMRRSLEAVLGILPVFTRKSRCVNGASNTHCWQHQHTVTIPVIVQRVCISIAKYLHGGHTFVCLIQFAISDFWKVKYLLWLNRKYNHSVVGWSSIWSWCYSHGGNSYFASQKEVMLAGQLHLLPHPCASVIPRFSTLISHSLIIELRITCKTCERHLK